MASESASDAGNKNSDESDETGDEAIAKMRQLVSQATPKLVGAMTQMENELYGMGIVDWQAFNSLLSTADPNQKVSQLIKFLGCGEGAAPFQGLVRVLRSHGVAPSLANSLQREIDCYYRLTGATAEGNDAFSVLELLVLHHFDKQSAKTAGGSGLGSALEVPLFSLQQLTSDSERTRSLTNLVLKGIWGDISLMTYLLQSKGIMDVSSLGEKSGIYLCRPSTTTANKQHVAYLALVVHPEDRSHLPFFLKALWGLCGTNEMAVLLKKSEANHISQTEAKAGSLSGVIELDVEDNPSEEATTVCCSLLQLGQMLHYYSAEDSLRTTVSSRPLSRTTRIACVTHDNDAAPHKAGQGQADQVHTGQPREQKVSQSDAVFPSGDVNGIVKKERTMFDSHRKKLQETYPQVEVSHKTLSEASKWLDSLQASNPALLQVAPSLPLNLVCQLPMPFLVVHASGHRLLAMPHRQQISLDQPTEDLFRNVKLSGLDYVLSCFSGKPVRIISVISHDESTHSAESSKEPSPTGSLDSLPHSGTEVVKPDEHCGETPGLSLVNHLAGCSFHKATLSDEGVWLQPRIVNGHLHLFLLLHMRENSTASKSLMLGNPLAMTHSHFSNDENQGSSLTKHCLTGIDCAHMNGEVKEDHTVITRRTALKLCLVACAALSHLTILAVDKQTNGTIGLLAEALRSHKEKSREKHERALFNGQLLVAAKIPQAPVVQELPRARGVVEKDRTRQQQSREKHQKALHEKAQKSEHAKFTSEVIQEVKLHHETFNEIFYKQRKTQIISAPSVEKLCQDIAENKFPEMSGRCHRSSNEAEIYLRMVLAKTLEAQDDAEADQAFSFKTIALRLVEKVKKDVEFAWQWGHVGEKASEPKPLTTSTANGVEEIPDRAVLVEDVHGMRKEVKLPDKGLLLVLDSGKDLKEATTEFISKFSECDGRHDILDQSWRAGFQSFLERICQRRIDRIDMYLEHKLKETKHIPQELKRDMMEPVRSLKQRWHLCDGKCSKCYHRCLLPQHEADDIPHDCLQESHECCQKCYLCLLEMGSQHRKGSCEAAICKLPSGHETTASRWKHGQKSAGRPAIFFMTADDIRILLHHDCGKDHPCPEKCQHLASSYNRGCQENCSLRIGHEQRQSSAQLPVHQCATDDNEHLCSKRCSMKDCNNLCAVHVNEKHKTRGRSKLHWSSDDIHLCGQEHPCQEWCAQWENGPCFQSDVALEENHEASELLEKKRAEQTAPNAMKLRCGKMIPRGELEHEGEHCHGVSGKTHHYCKAGCPLCGFVCELQYNHDTSRPHTTRHGLIQKDKLAQAALEFLAVPFKPTAEMQLRCDTLCVHQGSGRGHEHIVGVSTKRKTARRSKSFPNTHLLPHSEFWRERLFADPYTEEQQMEFAKCCVACLHDSHRDKQSYCNDRIGHEEGHCSEGQFIDVNGECHGYRSKSGHTFSCWHPCDNFCGYQKEAECDAKCAKSFDHEQGKCRCKSIRHNCRSKCNAPGCLETCTSAKEDNHEIHKCSSNTCPQKCAFPKCEEKCSLEGHFRHKGQHICSKAHWCDNLCAGPGWCKIQTDLVSVDGDKRLPCMKMVPPGQFTHDGLCSHSGESPSEHLCGQPCPFCGQHCHLPFRHKCVHDAVHGKVLKDRWHLIEIRDRHGDAVHGRWESDEVTCADLCTVDADDDKILRGHIHLQPDLTESFVVVEQDGKTSEDTITPIQLDLLHPHQADVGCSRYVNHDDFWTLVGFKDPVKLGTEQCDFGKCPCECVTCKDEGEEASLCTEPHPHKPCDAKEQGRPDWHVSRDGHHFECWHTCPNLCELSDRSEDCKKTCSLPKGHAGACHCSLLSHPCYEECSARSCQHVCKLSLEEHCSGEKRHDCQATVCPAPCHFNGSSSRSCQQTCQSSDHFHEDEPQANHLCGKEHACQGLCEGPGLCVLPEGDTLGDLSTTQLPCVVAIPKSKMRHPGNHLHSLKRGVRHLCGKQCKLCQRPCLLNHDHNRMDSPHKCDHGPVMHPDNVFILNAFGKRVLIPSGTRCDQLCSKGGWGHIHVTSCTRICRRDTKKAKHGCDESDNIRHDAFWAQELRFEDPYTQQEQIEFISCNVACSEHEQGDVVFCQRRLWHSEQDDKQFKGGCRSKTGCHVFPNCKHPCEDHCKMAGSRGCKTDCTSLLNHAGDHNCGGKHLCNKTCNAPNCSELCNEPLSGNHLHNCRGSGCQVKCVFGHCKEKCTSSNHFHGHGQDVTHLCSKAHVCQEKCEMDGLCQLGPPPPEMTSSDDVRSWTGDHQGKLPCQFMIPAGELRHPGKHNHNREASAALTHYCRETCPFCCQPCHRKINHGGLHETIHTRAQVKFDPKTGEMLGLDEGEEGLVCGQLCVVAGRGHVHAEKCPSKSKQNCQQLRNDAAHLDLAMAQLYVHTDSGKDVFSHKGYWQLHQFKDPASHGEQEKYFLCGACCPVDQRPCIAGPALHPKLERNAITDWQDESYFYDGHRFQCNHPCDETCLFFPVGNGSVPCSTLGRCAGQLHHKESHQCENHQGVCGAPCAGGGALNLCKVACQVPKSFPHRVHNCEQERQKCPFPCLFFHECGQMCSSDNHLHDDDVQKSNKTAHVCESRKHHFANSNQVKELPRQLRSAAMCLAKCPVCERYCNQRAMHLGNHNTEHSQQKVQPTLSLRDKHGRELYSAPSCRRLCESAGKDHTHLVPCSAKSAETCRRERDAPRHVKHFNRVGRTNYDQISHSAIWAVFQFDDPLDTAV